MNRSTSMALLRYQKPVDGVPDPGRSAELFYTSPNARSRKRTSEGSWNRGQRQTGEIFRGKYPMAVPSLPVIRHGCLLHSLAGADPRLQLLSNGATWYPVPGSTCTREQNFRVV